MDKYINKISSKLYDLIKDDYFFVRIYKISHEIYTCEIRSHNISASDVFDDIPETVTINTLRNGYVTFNLQFGVKAWDRFVHEMVRSARLRKFTQLTTFTDKIAEEYDIIRESIISMICWSPDKERANILLQIQDSLPEATLTKIKKRYSDMEVEKEISPFDAHEEIYLRFPNKGV